MSYGIKVFRKDAPPYILDENSIIMNLDGSVVTSEAGGNTNIKVAEDHDRYIVICSFPAYISYEERWVYNRRGYLISHDVWIYPVALDFFMDDSRNINFANNSRNKQQQISVLSWQEKVKLESKWGIALSGDEKISRVSTTLHRYFVAWKGEIVIPKEGLSLLDIDGRLNHLNSLFMYYTDDDSFFAAMSPRKYGEQQFVINAFDSENGNIIDEDRKIKLVIFSYLNIGNSYKKANWGLRINGSKDEVYNTNQEILINPRIINVKDFINVLKKIDNIDKPLLSLSPVYALMRGRGNPINGRIGTLMRKKDKVIAGESTFITKSDIRNFDQTPIISAYEQIVLDAEDYFIFSNINFSFNVDYVSVPVNESSVIVTYTVTPENTSLADYEFNIPELNKAYVDINTDKKEITIRRNGLLLEYSIFVTDVKNDGAIANLDIEFRTSEAVLVKEIRFSRRSITIPFRPYGTWNEFSYELIPEDANTEYSFQIADDMANFITVDKDKKIISVKHNYKVTSSILSTTNSENTKIGNLGITMERYNFLKLVGYLQWGGGALTWMAMYYKIDEKDEYIKLGDFPLWGGRGRVYFLDGTSKSFQNGRETFEFSDSGARIERYEYRNYHSATWWHGDCINIIPNQ